MNTIPKLLRLLVLTGLLSAARGALAADAAPATSRPFDGRESTPVAAGAQAGDSQIDKLVLGRLQLLGIQPAHLCSDAAFVRRVYLDVIGTLPTAQETKDFLVDPNPGKRSAMIERVLARDQFADYWAMKWSELLRVKAEFPIDLWPEAAQAYYGWVRQSLRENKPFDRFVAEILTAQGSNFRVPQVNFYCGVQSHQPQDLARMFALTFMGQRAENWPPERLAGLAGFFAQVGYKHTGEWKEEIVFWDAAAASRPAVFPDGTEARLTGQGDPRAVLSAWLLEPKNPCLARAAVNRIWAWLLGRGIINEPDDIRAGNPPSNPELLDYLAQQLVASRYDLKQVYRLILNSQTYQLSCIPKSTDPRGPANFASYPLRRLEAEVLIDALCQITGTSEQYSSAIPEPYTFIPEGWRAVALPDGSITSSFLEMFGRPARDTGLDSERNNRPSSDQRLHLLNSSHIQKKLEKSRWVQGLLLKHDPQAIASDAYLTVLSRYPTPDELKIVSAYFQPGPGKQRADALDLVWALINSDEFLYRH